MKDSKHSLQNGLKRMNVIIKQLEILNNLKHSKGRKYILLHIENTLQTLDILFCVISLNGNNKKVFQTQTLKINVFVSYIVTLFNK